MTIHRLLQAFPHTAGEEKEGFEQNTHDQTSVHCLCSLRDNHGESEHI